MWSRYTCIRPGDHGFRARALLFLCLAAALFLSNARAGTLETLVMPGEVIQGHAKLEKDCVKCHEPFSQEAQSALCRDCHKDVARDIRAGQGAHGRIPGMAKRECRSCHTDHKGRKADIVQLSKDTFDHGQTDFRLKGAHLKVDCTDCHKAGRKFRETPLACIGCHKADDPHKGGLGKACADCHQEQTWKMQSFDHGKTDFPLTGKHRDASCQSCHPDQHFKDTPADCNACHRINDVHAGKLGAKCDKCHTAERWKNPPFDHDRDTKFRLDGKHGQVRCEGCHKQDPKTEKLETRCYACHKKDDEHRGLNGEKCDGCHTAASWSKAVFDHDRKTKFSLRGRHKDLGCEDCHKQPVYQEKVKTACFACHREDDKHKGQEGEQCERCHNEQGWKTQVVFKHDLTRFPLIGLHAMAPCEECHLTAGFKDADTACSSCHKKDDVHKASLGTACGQCHNPNGWRLWLFDHNRGTDFALEGAHAEVACAACHKEARTQGVRVPSDCFACHQQDDIHKGNFGRNCEKCHGGASFRHLKIGAGSNKAVPRPPVDAGRPALQP